ncbi:DUF4142 domain-containing protein [Sphingobium bisphenolivorans]|uniref:DUF4142 domain-containing protein n=1 Tax=Sphingobium bisphenolivorans TaxID=1335760 RepID=UPI0003A5864F|nr:DUF4142 domain-containing protein [Sphingobium bisphenolivorans]
MKYVTSLLISSFAMLLPVAAQAEAPNAYLAKAGASDLFEQTSSKLVLQSTKDAKVRSFATMMVQDHGKSTAMLKAAAAKAKVKVAPPKLAGEQQMKIDALTKATGTARDTLYWEQQKAAHRQALALHQGYASTGTVPSLKTAAGQIVPVVKHHIEMLGGDKGGH